MTKSLPSGTVTFLFTDIEGSTRLAREHPEAWEAMRARHDSMLRAAIESNNGFIFQIVGDMFCSAFDKPGEALHAALRAQRDLQSETWNGTAVRVRMGIHTGEAETDGKDYHGYLTLSLVQRVMGAGHGGQVLLSNATEILLRGQLPKEVSLRDMGEHKLKDAPQPVRIFQVVAPDLQSEFPALRALDAHPNNLPAQLTSFIGREKEIVKIKKRLEKNRLVTLTGSGGVGKTRLSIRVASELLDEYPDGVWLVELAPLTDPALVTQAVCAALDITPQVNAPALTVLINYLRPKKTLLVVDNCEHLIDACARLCDSLLHACPDLQIIATGREALEIDGENAYSVPSLSLPDSKSGLRAIEESEAVKLFVERASAILPEFELTESNAPFVAQICQRLDGIALAIELAASRVKILKVEQIASRLDDAFRLLTGGSRIALPRQQTLHAMIDWSYDLLAEPERILFRRLAVFAGGLTLEAAEAVCGFGDLNRNDVLDLLGRLVDKSLVVVEADSGIGRTRYHLLETIRQYALEKLVEAGEAPAIRDRHLGFYLDLAEKSEPNIFGRESAVWFARLDKELDNIRVAIEWSTNSGKAVAALQIAGSMVFFWFSHGNLASEWHDRINQAMERPEGRERTLARAKALNGIGFMYWADIDPTDRRPELEEALSIAKEFGDRSNIATALRNLGILENIKGNYSEARSFLEESLKVWREMGPEGKLGSAPTLIFLGDVALKNNESEWARSLYEESATILREPGDINYLAYSVRRLAQLAWREGDFKKAFPLCKESLDLNRQIEDSRGVMACLAGFAAIAVVQRKFERAVKLMSVVETQLASIGIRLLFLDQMEFEHNLAFLRIELDEKDFGKFWAKGKTMSLEEAIDFALKQA